MPIFFVNNAKNQLTRMQIEKTSPPSFLFQHKDNFLLVNFLVQINEYGISDPNPFSIHEEFALHCMPPLKDASNEQLTTTYRLFFIKLWPKMNFCSKCPNMEFRP